jgi:hypothetical protein
MNIIIKETTSGIFSLGLVERLPGYGVKLYHDALYKG